MVLIHRERCSVSVRFKHYFSALGSSHMTMGWLELEPLIRAVDRRGQCRAVGGKIQRMAPITGLVPHDVATFHQDIEMQSWYSKH